jgi:hypothetical protein
VLSARRAVHEGQTFLAGASKTSHSPDLAALGEPGPPKEELKWDVQTRL